MSVSSEPNCADEFEAGTLPLSIAQQRILARLETISGSEVLSITSVLHRILAEAVTSQLAVPSYPNAAVDGFAVKGCELPAPGETKEFLVIGQALAGRPYTGPVGSSMAVSIMTGASLPEGTDTVLMQEHVRRQEDRILVDDRHIPGENVRQAGEDIECGETVLEPGRYLLPQDLGLLASLGRIEVSVKRCLRVALLSTGDEILPQGAPHQPGMIYDSNRFILMGALHKLPIEIIDYGVLPDDLDALRQTFQQAAQRCDVMISSGGVSVGAADYTKQVLTELGGIEFWKVAIKPGRPLAFGQIGDAWFFGLPGNPVAVLVTFYQFVLPALFRLSGADPLSWSPTFPAQAQQPLRKKPGRTEFQRGILSRGQHGHWQVKLSGKQGSGILTSVTRANCFIVLEHERETVQAGEWVEVLPFSVLM